MEDTFSLSYLHMSLVSMFTYCWSHSAVGKLIVTRDITVHRATDSNPDRRNEQTCCAANVHIMSPCILLHHL